MIVAEKDIEKNLMICYSYNNPMEVGQKYEKITTRRKTKNSYTYGLYLCERR